jgi:hypothetical protein
MLDNGWQNGSESVSKKLVLDTNKYPEFKADNPATSLKMLNDRVRAEGWRGLGVWVLGSGMMTRQSLERLKDAGVGLLKFDGGDASCRVTALARQYAPGLIVEHGSCVSSCPMNAYPGSGRVSDKDAIAQAATMQCGDAFRTYDTVTIFSVAECLDRQVKMLFHGASLDSDTRRHFGGSGEPAVTGALGGTIQPMRGNMRGQPMPEEFMVYASGPRQRQRREDEISRWVNWAKIAPPFGGGMQHPRGGGATAGSSNTSIPDRINMSELILWDSWKFAEADDAAVISHKLVNQTVRQGAPAVVTRGGLELPKVQAISSTECAKQHGEGRRQTDNDGNYCHPFVIATRFPNGATAVSTIGRTRPDQVQIQP